MTYIAQVCIDLSLTILLVVSISLPLRAGLLSLGHGALYAAGAYTAALVNTNCAVGFPLGSVAAIVSGGVTGLGLFFVGGRLRGEAFMLFTLAFQVAFMALISNWDNVTGGMAGLSGISRPQLGTHVFASSSQTAILYVALAAGTIGVIASITANSLGRVLDALRENELVARGCGVPRSAAYQVAFGLSGAIAGLAGSLLAYHSGYISPASFTLETGFLFLCACLLGGNRGLSGAIGAGSKNFIRINVMSDAIAPPLARFASRKSSKMAILYLNDDYGKSNRDLFKTTFERGNGRIVLSEPFESDPAVARALVEKVKASGADGCFIAGFGPAYPALFTRFRELAPTIQLYADIGLANAPVLAAVGADAEGVFLAATPADEFPAVSEAARAIAEKFAKTGKKGRPDYVFAFGYDSVAALLDALRAHPEGTPSQIREYMLQKRIEGIAGAYRFDPDSGDSVYADLPVYQISDGRLVRQADAN